LYIPKSHGSGCFRSALEGMTACAPRACRLNRRALLSKALSASKAPKSRSCKIGSAPMLSWRWPGSRIKRTKFPSASTRARISPRIEFEKIKRRDVRNQSLKGCQKAHLPAKRDELGTNLADRRPVIFVEIGSHGKYHTACLSDGKSL
jgi:hypothetical protein